MSLKAPNGARPRPAVTITCGKCGAHRRYEGDLLEALKASQDSAHWFTDVRGHFVCRGCVEAMK
jgi:hypothetical protein